MIQDKYTFIDFKHEPESEEAKSSGNGPIKRLPWLSASTLQWQRYYSEELRDFESYYHDLHYSVVQDPAIKEVFYIFNPETLVKVSVVSNEEIIENLYIRKRFDEALHMSRNSYGNPYLEKV